MPSPGVGGLASFADLRAPFAFLSPFTDAGANFRFFSPSLLSGSRGTGFGVVVSVLFFSAQAWTKAALLNVFWPESRGFLAAHLLDLSSLNDLDCNEIP
jgi:hypothetical protein